MTDREQNILTIVQMCEEIQASNESRYTKQCAQITAYEHIRDIMLGRCTDGEE